jgi:tetratricopeptide (TPR) repeat protein
MEYTGLTYGHLGKYDEALKYLKAALEIFKSIGAEPEVKVTLNNIATIKEQKKNKRRDNKMTF